MGQQQLLLIVLGVIIVGIAVVVGINVFTASSSSANADGMVADMTNLASMAQQYYRKPVALGGGGNAFDATNGGVAWAIPANLATTANGTYLLTASAADEITITGTGTENGPDGTTPNNVVMVVGPNAITSTSVNPAAAP